MASNLLLLQSTIQSIASRVLLSNALIRYTQGNNTDANWVNSAIDLQRAMASGGASLLLQARVYPPNNTGLNGPYPLINVTGDGSGNNTVLLPYNHKNGTQVMLGDPFAGYPRTLYPNITYNASGNGTVAYIDNRVITPTTQIFLGPLQVNSSFALFSVSLPVVVNSTIFLGYITVVSSARLMYEVFDSIEGLENTGEVLLFQPTTFDNRLPPTIPKPGAKSATNPTVENTQIKFLFPPIQNSTRGIRHAQHAVGTPNAPFALKDYPAVLELYTKNNKDVNNAGSNIRTTNEEGIKVSVGYAMPQSPLCNWALLVEQDQSEALAPIHRLRNVLLACVFGTLGAIMLALFPIAHYSVRPIRRLRAATKQSIKPRLLSIPSGSSRSSSSRERERGVDGGDLSSRDDDLNEKGEKSFMATMVRWGTRKKSPSEIEEEHRRVIFRIPGKVRDRRHCIHDELTDLTQTFNEMSEELVTQYERLEEKVKERTQELELSKKAAEAANESKTLFIANISHELKTPLNGILGMCAVLIGEDDMTKIKRSLGIVYKSGDLLLHLLNDLLTFSKNQIGQVLTLEEQEFRLSEVSSQIVNIFERQAQKSKIKFHFSFQGLQEIPNAPPSGVPIEKGFGPPGTGRIRDMCLWGDQNRILQVVINLVSNSLKFTPPGQSIDVRIRCLGEMEEESTEHTEESRRNSLKSQRSSQKKGKTWGRVGSSTSRLSTISKVPSRSESERRSRGQMSTALRINPMDSKPFTQLAGRERSMSPPPLNTRTLIFEFEVEDTGPGIAENQQEQVFEPFMQGDLGLSKKYQGTGLGLSICSQLATLMRGNIRLRSQIGSGSTFTMRIPLKYTKTQLGSSSSSMKTSSRRSSFALNALSDDTKADMRSVEETAAGVPSPDMAESTLPMNTDKPPQPRLVGLSQPFFTNGSGLDKPSQQIAAIKKMATEVSKTGDKLRVLVAEDNQVNQEVVLRMLKLEDIYGKSFSRF
jgi:osomolarity two-component system sensor histidine kinase SLN1